LYASYIYPGYTHKEPSTPIPGKEQYAKFSGDYLHVSMPIVFEEISYGTIVLQITTSQLKATTYSRIFLLLLVMCGSILISYVLAQWFQKYISLPILKLAHVTEDVSRDIDYSIRVEREEKDEIGSLYAGFNNMLEKIQLWERKRDEAEAEQKRLLVELEAKNKELEQVVYVTSHDLRSPLVNIQGFGQELGYSIKEVDALLKDLHIESAELKEEILTILEQDIMESLKYIQSSTNKMDGLLSGLLRLSRVGRMSTTFEVIDMNYLMSEISNSFEFHIKEVKGALHVEELPACYGCELEVNQVFSNLIGNAIKYRSSERPPEIKVSGSLSPDEKQVIYSVSDNGMGIPEEYQKKIFHIFHRLKPEESEGEGLGLAIVHKIVHRHNGAITVESEPGVGSVFTVIFPAVPDSLPQGVENASGQSSTPSTVTGQESI
jgi:signal transduction histidine kinase